jgi:hypothetical protein
MANLDTADKRFSMLDENMTPTPDGAFDSAGDRLQVMGLYRGIAPDAPAAGGGEATTTLERWYLLKIKRLR